MIKIHSFTFNDFQENTYILYDESCECIIIDPGCYLPREELQIKKFISQKNLKPTKLLNTHCHIDHVFGNSFIAQNYNLELEIHTLELRILEAVKEYSKLYGYHYAESPKPNNFLMEGDPIEFGNSKLETLFVPGHSPGHLAFISPDQKFIIGGDVLFQGSVGRTDLPGGDHATLISSIKTKILPLDEDYQVFAGHGPSTNIAYEKENNPFLK